MGGPFPQPASQPDRQTAELDSLIDVSQTALLRLPVPPPPLSRCHSASRRCSSALFSYSATARACLDSKSLPLLFLPPDSVPGEIVVLPGLAAEVPLLRFCLSACAFPGIISRSSGVSQDRGIGEPERGFLNGRLDCSGSVRG